MNPRLVRAYLRDTRVLVRQFRFTLLVFIVLLFVGTLVLHFAYDHPRLLSWGRAFGVTFGLMFFEIAADFPEHLLAQVVFVLWPLLGLALVVNGVVQFGTALFNRHERREAWQVAVASTFRDHIIVCGLGKLGYSVVLQLLQLKQEVVGIERNPQGRFLEQLQKEGVPTLVGDACQEGMLEKAGVRSASAIVACTENDLANLEIALDAREMNPGIKVVLRMFDQQLVERVRRGFGIKTTFSTSSLAAPAFAAAATRAAVNYSFYVDDVLLNVSRVAVAAGSPLVGMSIADVERELDLSVILHRGEAGVDLHPADERRLAAGDEIVVSATLEALACLNRLNEGGQECLPRERGPRTWFGRRREKRAR